MNDNQQPLADVAATTVDAQPPAVAQVQLYLPITPHGPTRYCSLPVKTNEDKAAILRLAQGSDQRAEDMIDQPFPTVHLVVYPDQVEAKETGELITLQRTVWVGPEGKSLSIASDWTPSAMDKVRALYGDPPWNPPLNLVVRTRRTRNSRTMYWVDVVFPQAAPAAKKGRG